MQADGPAEEEESDRSGPARLTRATAPGWSRLSGYELQAGHAAQALQLAEAAAQVAPDYPPALLARGKALAGMGKIADAISPFGSLVGWNLPGAPASQALGSGSLQGFRAGPRSGPATLEAFRYPIISFAVFPVLPARSRFCNPLAASLAFLLATSGAWAAFSGSLTPDEQSRCGLSRLAKPETARLDQLVARDERFAREGGVSAFDRTFSARLKSADFGAAGLSHLAPQELARLDELVAFQIAHPAPEVPHFEAKTTGPSSDQAATRPGSAAVAPSPAAVAPAWHPEIHGDVSFTVGGGKGGSFYGGGMALRVTDPSGNFTVEAGFYDYHAKGRFFPLLCPGPGIDPEWGPDGPPINPPRP